ncbi:heavy metal-associated isoprenylated plant protein 6-like [Nymphaea colorata]|uniref:heavy metal-associated isoprenylated plant protein 6-like n=1 Tax=Nymphaea colorata TaxID=210225 RepID=UPI00214EA6BD|nr:heavy metal-associated isoprenylated plant protein 6-like [Nymphaea colorata]
MASIEKIGLEGLFDCRDKVYSLVITAKLDCPRCHEKIKKAVCSICVCEISSKNFDEKSNKVTLVGVFDPKKVVKKICQKAGKCIDDIVVSEVVNKKPDSGAASSTKKKDPAGAPPTKEKTGGAKEKPEAEEKDKGSEKKKDPSQSKKKTKAGGGKDGAKETDKSSKEKIDPPSPEQVEPVVIVVHVPPAAAAPPAVPADPQQKPQREVIECPPVALLGAPIGGCHCGQSHCGSYYWPCPRPGYETRPFTCGCSNHPCSISSQLQCPGNCAAFSVKTQRANPCKKL